jgi:hypothetical protein
MKRLLKKLFLGKFDNIVEGNWAHEYSCQTQDQIRQEYLKTWGPADKPKTPLTHPWLFDPCNPPKDWVYDPYYEIWIFNSIDKLS